MKKYAIIAGVLTVIGTLCVGMINSHVVFNQPKTPSLLSE